MSISSRPACEASTKPPLVTLTATEMSSARSEKTEKKKSERDSRLNEEIPQKRFI